jgi:peptide/nickel transport system ATP-binding protein
MSVRAKILELMLALKRDFDLTYLYITHDLATAKFFCDRIAIMYLGRIVEIGPSAAIYADPKHPYTQALLRAIPEPDPRRSVPRDLPRGEVPDAARPPLGCSFHPRCPKAFEVCGWETRDLRDLFESRWAGIGQEQYERERGIVGDLAALDAAATSARVPAARGAEELLDLLHAMRDENPDEPFWRGVRALRPADGHVEIEWHEAIVPRLLPTGGAEVECHLYDERALVQARELQSA